MNSKIIKVTHCVTTPDGNVTEYIQQSNKTIYLNYSVNVKLQKSLQTVQTHGSIWQLTQKEYDDLIKDLTTFIEICEE